MFVLFTLNNEEVAGSEEKRVYRVDADQSDEDYLNELASDFAEEENSLYGITKHTTSFLSLVNSLYRMMRARARSSERPFGLPFIREAAPRKSRCCFRVVCRRIRRIIQPARRNERKRS